MIEFDWDSVGDRLKVTVHPRAWDDDKKRFEDDPVRLGGHEPVHFLGCPNFRKAPLNQPAAAVPDRTGSEPDAAAVSQNPESTEENAMVPSDYPLVLLRFFRDLTDGQRLAVLVKLGGLPPNWSEASSHALERKILDALVLAGRIEEVKHAIEEQRNRP